MGQDDDEDCPVHDWEPTEIHAGLDGAHVTYRCVRCEAVLATAPGDERPD